MSPAIGKEHRSIAAAALADTSISAFGHAGAVSDAVALSIATWSSGMNVVRTLRLTARNTPRLITRSLALAALALDFVLLRRLPLAQFR